jgi:hypothetical protein
VRPKPGLDQAARLAAGLKPIARFVCITSLVAAAAITWWLWSWLHFSTGWIVGTSLLLGLPAILYGFLWWLLWALSEMSSRIDEAVGTLDDIRTRPSLPQSAGAFRRLGRLVGDAWRISDQADNVLLPVSAVMLLGNPVGLLVLAIGFAYGALLWFIATIWGIGRLLFA